MARDKQEQSQTKPPPPSATKPPPKRPDAKRSDMDYGTPPGGVPKT